MNKKDSALNEYSTAIYLTPELVDSKLWMDMELEQPLVVKDVIEKVQHKLELDKNSNDPIVLSKQAKVYIYQKCYKKAKEILLNVTKKLPNLSRPWYNLGYLYELENDTVNMVKCYNIALLNDVYYYTPCLRLAYYYDKIGFKRDAVQNYKATINYWNRISTEHSQRCKALYFVDGVRNDIIPMGLLEYTKPFVDTMFINKRIRELQNNN
jgi:tetratricopeptide (TPR) repeat protein